MLQVKINTIKMRIKATILLITLLFSFSAYSQVTNANTTGATKPVFKSCRNPIENKSITLCDIKSDTVTYAQLKSCGELHTENKKEKIDSYRLNFSLANGTEIIEYKGTSNKIPDEALNMIIESKANKILFEEIYGTRDNENIVLGLRWFYLKKE